MITAIDAMVLLGCAFMLYGSFRLMAASRRKWKVEGYTVIHPVPLEKAMAVPREILLFEWQSSSFSSPLAEQQAKAFRKRMDLPGETVDE